MLRSVSCVLALALGLIPVAGGQNYYSVCGGGVHADGYIDLTGLPPAPTVAIGSSSAPITTTLPVQGIPGLTVQVTIPSVKPYLGGSLYSTHSGQLNFGSNPEGGVTLQLEFSKPVYGISFDGTSPSRGAGFSLTTNEATGRGEAAEPGPNFSAGSSGDIVGYTYFNGHLEAQGNLSEAFLYVPFGGYGGPTLSNIRVQSQPALNPDVVTHIGLQMWLPGPLGSPFEGTPPAWLDQSGNGHDATPDTNAPQFAPPSGANCQGGYTFVNNESFHFNLPIDGWDQMTVFLVSRTWTNPPPGTYASEAAAILWNENALWGNTFISPAQSSVPFRFGTGQVNNQPIAVQTANAGQDFTITRTVHDKNVDSLYVNSVLLLSQYGKQPVLAGTTGAGFIGRGINNTYFNGEISEILVYNRVLSDSETAAVESYLRNKFGTR